MVDQSQACELLGLSATNASAIMERREDKRELLRFTMGGRSSYPLFQFDVEGRRIFAVMTSLIALKPRTWSDFRLLQWLTRPHLDFGGAPSEFLGSQEQAVADAFKREIEPSVPRVMRFNLTIPAVTAIKAGKEAYIEIFVGIQLHRVHPAMFGAADFNPTDTARFSPIRDAHGKVIPTIYATETFPCTACEIILCCPDTPPVDPATGLATLQIVSP